MVPSFILSCLLCSISIASSARILFVAMPQGKSHRASMYPFAGTLASRGHEVVLLGLVLDDNSQSPAGFEERLVHVKGADVDLKNVVFKNSSYFMDIMWNYRFRAKSLITRWYNFGLVCQLFLEHQKNEFLQIAQEPWDLILIDRAFEQCAMALTIVRSDVPYTVFHTSGLVGAVANLRALAIPPHTRCPSYLSPTWLFDCKKFLDRSFAVLQDIQLQVMYSWILDSIVQWSTHAVTEGRLSYPEYIRKSSGDFVEYPNPIDWTKPTGSDVFSVGAYCYNKNAKPLSDDLASFVNDNSSRGTILVAFGTNIDWVTAPQEKVEIFYNALNELTQYRIIWQFHGGEAKFPIPKHMRLMAWLPQIDILTHPKTRLFISHGGLKSFKEAICAEVPLLFLPMFADQPRNAQSAKRFGIGEIVDKLTMETDEIVRLVHQITNTESYMTNIRKTKTQFVDRVVPSLDEGAFWAEYIIRHGGMPAIHRRKGIDLNWMQYWCIDVIALFIAVISFISYIFWRII